MRNECNDTIEYLNQVIEDTRNLARELCPSILEDLGLGTALRRLVAQFTKLSRCNVISRIEDFDRRLPKEAEVDLYRIVQAALTNIEQHALARSNVTGPTSKEKSRRTKLPTWSNTPFNKGIGDSHPMCPNMHFDPSFVKNPE